MYIKENLLRNCKNKKRKKKPTCKYKESLIFSLHVTVDCVVCHLGYIYPS